MNDKSYDIALLRAAPKGDADASTQCLTPVEDQLLREAFGRYGGEAQARADAALVVARYQQMGGGMWFVCGCREDGGRFPVLVPVSQTHIRRHEDGIWPGHDEACDFFRDPEQQCAILRSYRRESGNDAIRLARAFGEPGPKLERAFVGVSVARSRPTLARLLARIVDDAGLQKIPPGWRKPPSLRDQSAALWEAARGVYLDSNVRLPDFFCTSARKLGELVEKIGKTRPGRFTCTRPHGVLIARLEAIHSGALEPMAGDPIPVRGRIAVFGERAGRGGSLADNARAPYLAACVVGRAEDDGPVEVLSAYAHPCASADHLMLVDSDYERRTLAQLRSLQEWLEKKRGVGLTIEKPVFELGSVDEGENSSVGRGVCIPDFVLRATGVGDGGHEIAIIETMGFADASYRTRKTRMHAMMSAALGGAPVVMHDFVEIGSMSREEYDRAFWRGLMRLVAGRGDVPTRDGGIRRPRDIRCAPVQPPGEGEERRGTGASAAG